MSKEHFICKKIAGNLNYKEKIVYKVY